MAAYQPTHAWWARYNYTWTKDLAPGLLKRGRNRIVVRVISNEKGGYSGTSGTCSSISRNKEPVKRTDEDCPALRRIIP